MSDFRYKPEMANPGWEGISDDARNALSDLAINKGTMPLSGQEHDIERQLTPEEQRWALPQIIEGLNSWQRYQGSELDVPATPVDFFDNNLNFLPAIKKLHAAYEDLIALGVTEDLKLTLVPYGAFLDNYDQLDPFLQTMRERVGKIGEDRWDRYDISDNKLYSALDECKPMYKAPANNTWISAKSYLLSCKRHMGDWGLVLMNVGTVLDDSFRDMSASQLTSNGGNDFILAGENVGAMGFYEWYAMALQHDYIGKQSANGDDVSLLLANMMIWEREYLVATAKGLGAGATWIKWERTDFSADYAAPRIAVLGYVGEKS